MIAIALASRNRTNTIIDKDIYYLNIQRIYFKKRCCLTNILSKCKFFN